MLAAAAADVATWQHTINDWKLKQWCARPKEIYKEFWLQLTGGFNWILEIFFSSLRPKMKQQHGRQAHSHKCYKRKLFQVKCFLTFVFCYLWCIRSENICHQMCHQNRVFRTIQKAARIFGFWPKMNQINNQYSVIFFSIAQQQSLLSKQFHSRQFCSG